MKRLVIFLLAVAVNFNCLRSQNLFSQIQQDKYLHFGAGYCISLASYSILKHKNKAFDMSFGIGAAAGGIKEGIDILGYGNASFADFTTTLKGALFGTVTYKVFLNFKQRKQGNYQAWQGTDYEFRQRRNEDSLEIDRHKWRPPRDSLK